MKRILAFAIAAAAAFSSVAQTKIDLGTQVKGSLSGLAGVNATAPTSVWDVREGNAFDTVFTFNGVATYTDQTTEAKTTAGTAFTVMYNSTQYLYLGKTTTWKDISFVLSATATASNTLVTQYWDGSTWATLTVTDGTANLQNNGTITFTIPGGWAQTAVNGTTRYWVRLAFASTPSTAPTVLAVRPGSNNGLAVLSSPSDTVAALQVSFAGKTLVNGVAVAPSATYTVGLASDKLGKNADFSCSGAKDQVCIQKAVTACGGTPCVIQFLTGTFNLTGSITPLYSNITFRGLGAGKTILKTSNFMSATFLDQTTGTLAAPLENLVFEDFEIDRDLDTKDGNIGRKCIFVTHMRNVVIRNMYAHGSGASCFGIDYLDGGFIYGNRITNAGSTGTATGNSAIGIGTGEYTAEPVIISGNILDTSGLSGVLLEGQNGTVGTSNNQIVIGNVITGAGKYGIYNRGVSNVILSGNIVRSSGIDGVIITDYSGGVSANVLVKDNLINGSAGYGVRVSAASNQITVDGNVFQGNASGSVTWTLPSVTACTGATIAASSGQTFTIGLGTSCTGIQSATVTLPLAPTGWFCTAGNITSSASLPRQTGAASTTTVTISNFNAAGTATDWTASDQLRLRCNSY